jgi:hypothetical protein
VSTETKAAAWEAAATLIEATLGSDVALRLGIRDDELQQHIISAVVPHLKRRAEIIRGRRKYGR